MSRRRYDGRGQGAWSAHRRGDVDASIDLDRVRREGRYQDATKINYETILEIEKQLADAERIEESGDRLVNDQVTDADIAEVVAAWTGIPVGRLLAGETEKLLNLEGNLGRVGSHDGEPVDRIAEPRRVAAGRLGEDQIALAKSEARVRHIGAQTGSATTRPTARTGGVHHSPAEILSTRRDLLREHVERHRFDHRREKER